MARHRRHLRTAALVPRAAAVAAVATIATTRAATAAIAVAIASHAAVAAGAAGYACSIHGCTAQRAVPCREAQQQPRGGWAHRPPVRLTRRRKPRRHALADTRWRNFSGGSQQPAAAGAGPGQRPTVLLQPGGPRARSRAQHGPLQLRLRHGQHSLGRRLQRAALRRHRVRRHPRGGRLRVQPYWPNAHDAGPAGAPPARVEATVQDVRRSQVLQRDYSRPKCFRKQRPGVHLRRLLPPHSLRRRIRRAQVRGLRARSASQPVADVWADGGADSTREIQLFRLGRTLLGCSQL
mmetsp:Transcript_72419/g.217572  ORF Transcript_72419/g.217572 Transcript_72419/m.217572 type:complete len:293 (+) Transcript_72419:542-1420(+)